jgi:hypothetical protein
MKEEDEKMNDFYNKCDVVLNLIFDKPDKPFSVVPLTTYQNKQVIVFLENNLLMSTNTPNRKSPGMIYTITKEGKCAKKLGVKTWHHLYNNKIADEPFINKRRVKIAYFLSIAAIVISFAELIHNLIK